MDKYDRNDKNIHKKMETITLKLSGLHCTSCALNIDMTLEDLPGVKSKTNYQKSETIIHYDPSKNSPENLKKIIAELGYTVL